MSRSVFSWLVEALQPKMECQYIAMGEPVSIEKHIATLLWWLVNTICYCLTGNQFGTARSTVVGIVILVCRLMEELLSKVVQPGPLWQVCW